MGYTDLTSEFDYKDLITWVNLDALSENDSYDIFLAGTVAIFYQASAPAGWTKSTDHNDKAFRVISGSGGSSGGTTVLSSTITLNHTHTVPSHSHTTPSHTHDLGYDVGTYEDGGTGVSSGDADGSGLQSETSGSSTVRRVQNVTRAIDPADSGSTSPGMDTKLTNFALAYVDAIIATKDA